MTKKFGNYAVHLNGHNLITITKDGMTIHGESVKPAETGSRFEELCDAADKYNQKQSKL